MSQQPAHRIRISNLSAVSWGNTGEDGPWYSVNLERSYKNGDDEWRQTECMGFDDLLLAAKVLDQSHSWIAGAMAADRAARKQAEQAA